MTQRVKCAEQSPAEIAHGFRLVRLAGGERIAPTGFEEWLGQVGKQDETVHVHHFAH